MSIRQENNASPNYSSNFETDSDGPDGNEFPRKKKMQKSFNQTRGKKRNPDYWMPYRQSMITQRRHQKYGPPPTKPDLKNDETIKRVLSAKQNQIDKYRNRLNELEIQFEAMRKENQDLRREQKRNEKSLEKIESSKSDLPALLMHHQSEVSSLRRQLASSKEKIAESQEQIRTANKKNEQHLRQIDSLKKLSEDQNLKEREDLQKKVEQLEADLDEAEKRAKNNERKTELIGKNNNNSIANLNQKIKKLQQQNESLSHEKNDLNQKIQDKQKQLDILNIYVRRKKGTDSNNLSGRTDKQKDVIIEFKSLTKSAENKKKERSIHDESVDVFIAKSDAQLCSAETQTGEIQENIKSPPKMIDIATEMSLPPFENMASPVVKSSSTPQLDERLSPIRREASPHDNENYEVHEISDKSCIILNEDQHLLLMAKINGIVGEESDNEQETQQHFVDNDEQHEISEEKTNSIKQKSHASSPGIASYSRRRSSYQFSDSVQRLHEGLPVVTSSRNQESKRESLHSRKSNETDFENTLPEKNDDSNKSLGKLKESNKKKEEEKIFGELFGDKHLVHGKPYPSGGYSQNQSKEVRERQIWTNNENDYYDDEINSQPENHLIQKQKQIVPPVRRISEPDLEEIIVT